MEDHNSPEAVANRANQEDPIVMYLIVRESLGMGMGKTAAQCAHASQMLLLNYTDLDRKETCGWFSDSDRARYQIFIEWLSTSFRKVVLKADDKEWAKLKVDLVEDVDVIVVDAGLTEIAPNSETVIGLWPMKRSNVPKLVKRLQVLK
jgi:cytochrome c oxidase assembly factor 4